MYKKHYKLILSILCILLIQSITTFPMNCCKGKKDHSSTIKATFESVKKKIENNKPLSNADLLYIEKTKKEVPKDDKGWTLLMYATIANHEDAVSALIEFGSNINDTNEEGQTAVHLAAYHARPAMLQMLLAHNAQASIKDENKKTPLKIARERAKKDEHKKQLFNHCIAILKKARKK